MAEGVSVRVNGREFSGWKSVDVTRTIDDICGSFTLSVSDVFGENDEPWPIREEDECQVLIDGEVVLTGYVDQRTASLNMEDHGVTITGRDKASALVDCCPDLEDWDFRGPSLIGFLNTMAQPYGVTIKIAPGQAIPTPKEKFSVSIGDTIFSVVDRVAKYLGLLPVSDGNGNVVLMVPGQEHTLDVFTEGDNIKSGESNFRADERFGKVRVLGQSWGGAAHVKGEARDLSVARSGRTLIVPADSSLTIAEANKMAEWEIAIRAARAETVTIDVLGWHGVGGNVHQPGTQMMLDSPVLGVNGPMLLQTATFRESDDSGRISTLTFCRPDAYAAPPKTSEWKL